LSYPEGLTFVCAEQVVDPVPVHQGCEPVSRLAFGRNEFADPELVCELGPDHRREEIGGSSDSMNNAERAR
jgi:hypothetical protein